MDFNGPINDFAVVCDIYGNIIEVISNGEYEKNLVKDHSLSLYIDGGSNSKFFEFIKKIREDGYVLGYEMNMVSDNSIVPVNFCAYREGNKIYIAALKKDIEVIEILNKVVKINNEYVNSLRTVLKEKAASGKTFDDSVFFEISRLNNELLNSKRLIAKQNAKLSEYNKHLEEMAMKDSLTGAYNRRYLYKIINAKAEEAKKLSFSFVLMIIDFNDFKKVNDLLGHDAGDELLIRFAKLCNKNLRNGYDFLFRLGGDEFIILFMKFSEEKALSLAEKINREFKKYTNISSLSYGAVEIKPDDIKSRFNIDKYLKIADRRMYCYKKLIKGK